MIHLYQKSKLKNYLKSCHPPALVEWPQWNNVPLDGCSIPQGRSPLRRGKCTALFAVIRGMMLGLVTGFFVQPLNAQPLMENLNRGVVAVPDGKGNVFVSWRLLATDSEGVAFNLYRTTNGGEAIKLNEQPITGATNFVDQRAEPEKDIAYVVRPVVSSMERSPSNAFQLDAAHPYLSVPLQTPDGYTPNDAGANFRDAATGEILWKKPSVKAGDDGEGPGRGNAFNIDPRHPGAEAWVHGANVEGMFNAKGEKISDQKPAFCNFGVWWDGDPLRELLDGNVVAKWDWQTEELNPMLIAEGAVSNNGTKATPALSGDILGDWREEVMLRSEDNDELRIYTTTIPTEHRMVTLLHDRQYRLALAWQNVAYNQPPHPGFYIDKNMEGTDRPDIDIVK